MFLTIWSIKFIQIIVYTLSITINYFCYILTKDMWQTDFLVSLGNRFQMQLTQVVLLPQTIQTSVYRLSCTWTRREALRISNAALQIWVWSLTCVMPKLLQRGPATEAYSLHPEQVVLLSGKACRHTTLLYCEILLQVTDRLGDTSVGVTAVNNCCIHNEVHWKVKELLHKSGSMVLPQN
jgi:hypothetical protein